MLPEYKDYNKMEVTLFVAGKQYVVSNINKRGLSSQATSDSGGAHLKSFSMNLTAVGDGNKGDTGSEGSLTLVDCNDSLIKFLVGGFNEYSHKAPSDGTFPELLIKLWCFTGEKTWSGFVKDWELSFSGGVPEVKFNWTIFPLDNGMTEPMKVTRFYDPGALVDAIQTKFFKDCKIDFLFLETDKNNKLKIHKNKEIGDFVRFTGKDNSFLLDPAQIDKYIPNVSSVVPQKQINESSNKLVATYMYILDNLCYSKEGDPLDNCTLVECTLRRMGDIWMSDKSYLPGKKNSRGFFAFELNRQDKPDKVEPFVSEETNATNELVFTYNSNIPAYKKCHIKFDESGDGEDRINIPIDGYSFSINNASIHLNQKMIFSINGSYFSGTTGIGQAADADAANNATAKNAGKNGNPMKFSFKCWNVACFQCFNKAAPINIFVFDENGNKRDYLCVNNTVVERVNYSLTGPIIEADVTCTTELSQSDKDITNDKNEKAQGDATVGEDAQEEASN